MPEKKPAKKAATSRAVKIKDEPEVVEAPAGIGHVACEQGDGVTVLVGSSLDVEAHQNLNVCFNGRTYHAESGAFGDFRCVVPAFEGEVEVYLSDKLDPRLLAKGVA